MATPEIEVYFASNNPHKVIEVRELLKLFGISVKQLKSKVREIQSNSIEEIAVDSARVTAQAVSRTVVVEDAGLFIEVLRGFPGPYSSYVYSTIGCNGIIKLMEGSAEREATFRSAVCYCEPNGKPKVFAGETKGKISLSERPGREFGYDPIFIPDEIDHRAFSELSVEEKNKVSHRSRAFSKLANWLLQSRSSE